MKKDYENKFLYSLGVTVINIIIILFVIQIIHVNLYRNEFWQISVNELINIFIALIVGYFIKEYKQERIRRHSGLEKIMDELEDAIASDRMVSRDGKLARMPHTSCANRIQYLLDAGFDEFEDELNFIAERLEKIRDLYSENESIYNQNLYEMNRLRTHVVDKCIKIRIELYK